MNNSTSLARVIVRQIIEAGITDVVVSPGSRNAPLSLAFFAASKRGLIKLHVRIDERTAAFFALGIIKATGRPVPIVCTSGTAVANFHPAVLEASHTNAPLLVLTADRPKLAQIKQPSKPEFMEKQFATLQILMDLFFQWSFHLIVCEAVQCI
jgi:2-succinyl-5-enolpyruvyl-6-hydroxy-3-cyclohexene-1-carboxylate synthase